MKHIIIILLITFFFTSCSNNDDSIEEPEELIADCKVIGTNGKKNLNPFDIVVPTIDNGSYTIDNPGPIPVYSEEDLYDSETYNNAEIVFLTQYEYDSENRLITRVNYDDIFSFDSEFHKDTDNITYDTSNRISEISTFNRFLQYTAIKVFEYDDSETLPSKLTRYRVDESEDSPLLSYTEDFTYNNQHQLMKVVKNYREGSIQNPVETTYEYNLDGNLTKIEAVSSGENEFDNWTQTVTFGNYDNQRNPFKGLPFSDLRGISESNNNYFKYSRELHYLDESNGVLQTSSFPSESSGWEYTPTDLSYLETAAYQCEE